VGDLFGGGGSTTKVTIPSWIQEPMQRGIARAEQIAKMGYQPYYGPEVAAFTPMQQQAMQSQYDAAAAFGMAPMGGDAMAGMPTPTEFTGGLLGYSSGDLFEQSVNEFQKRQPDQAAIYNSQFVGPNVSNPNFYPPGNQPPYSGLPPGYPPPLTGNPLGYNINQGAPNYSFVGGSTPSAQPEFFNGYPSATLNADGMPSGGMPAGGNYQDGIMYGQNMYNQGQTVIPQGQNMYNQGQNIQPGSITPPTQNEAMAMDLWSQAQGAMDSGSLSDADRFLTQYQNITGTREPMFGLGALDPSGYYASKNQGMTM
jgi:hypothetical protein